jgi:hypothetical protein
MGLAAAAHKERNSQNNKRDPTARKRMQSSAALALSLASAASATSSSSCEAPPKNYPFYLFYFLSDHIRFCLII